MNLRLQTCVLSAGLLLAGARTATAQGHVSLPGIETAQIGQTNQLNALAAAPAGGTGNGANPASAPAQAAAGTSAAPAAATASSTPATGVAAAIPPPAGSSAPPATGTTPKTAAEPKNPSEVKPGKGKAAADLPTGPVDSSLHLQPGMGPSGLQIQGVPGGTVPWSIVIVLTGLTLIPALLLCVTPFARLLIVFHFLRQALGLQTTPSNQTLIGLSLILTFFLMQPVATQIYDNAVVPMQSGQISATAALERGEVPLRAFMSHYVRDKDVALFIELAKEPQPKTLNDVSMRVLLPAYILSELKAGFQIGTVLFLPFLIVDMVVASITTSVGMLQLPPVVISTPLKLLLFLMVDGWHLLIGSLMRSFS